MVQVLWVRKLEEVYIFGKEVDSGTYGRVKDAVLLDSTEKKTFVCKVVQRQGDYVRELDHLIYLSNCVGVLPLRRAVFTPSELCLEFEKADTSLHNHIKENRVKNRENLKEHLRESLNIIRQLFFGLAEMHAQGIAHRDIKSGNVVIMKLKQTKAWIIDLGMSKRIRTGAANEPNKVLSLYEIVTSTYRAPELWRPERKIAKKPDPKTNRQKKETIPRPSADNKTHRYFDDKIDIWALGCILFEMVVGKSPFRAAEELDVRKRLAGYLLNCRGCYPESIWSGETDGDPVKVNLDKELDDVFERTKSSFTPGHRRSRSREETTPVRQSSKIQHQDDISLGDSEMSLMVYVIKKLIRMTLSPIPEERPTALECIQTLNKYLMHPRDFVPPSNQSSVIKICPVEKKQQVQLSQLMENFYAAVDYLMVDPNIVFLSSFLLLRATPLLKKQDMVTLLLACVRIACSYSGGHPSIVRELRKMIISGKTRKEKSPRETSTPKRETGCVGQLIVELKGQVWLHNPSDQRHLFEGSTPHVWHPKIDQTIFGVMVTCFEELQSHSETISVDPKIISDRIIGRVTKILQQNNDKL